MAGNSGGGTNDTCGFPRAGLRHARRPNPTHAKDVAIEAHEAQLIHHYHSSAVLHLTCHADNSSSVACEKGGIVVTPVHKEDFM